MLPTGFIADLLSRPVLIGYMAGIALIMIAGQLGKLTGTPVTGEGFVAELRSLAAALPNVALSSVGSRSLDEIAT